MLFAHHIFLCDLIVLTMQHYLPERRREQVFTVGKIAQVEVGTVAERPIKAVGGVEEGEDEDDEWEYQDESDVYVRSKFFESWLWKIVDLPAQADRDG